MANNIGNLQNKDGDLLFPNNINVITNSNGTAYQFPSGLMICTGSGSGLDGGTRAINFAASFISVPIVTCSAVSAVGNPDNYIIVSQITSVVTTGMSVTIWSGSAPGVVNFAKGGDPFNYIAVGNWK